MNKTYRKYHIYANDNEISDRITKEVKEKMAAAGYEYSDTERVQT